MIGTWHLRKQEESYLGQLEQMLVQRIRCSDDGLRIRADFAHNEELSDFSRDINEELGRIESLVKEYEQT